MPIIVERIESGVRSVGRELSLIVRAGLPVLDGCTVLTRLKAFVTDQGVRSVLEHVFRDRSGNALDLSSYLSGAVLSLPVSFGSISSVGSASSAGAAPLGSAALRVRDVLGHGANPTTDPILELVVNGYVPSEGIIRSAQLPQTLVDRAGVYQLSWAIKDDAGRVVAINDGLLSIERSAFPTDEQALMDNLGPPTINEIRMTLMDSSAAENVLLDAVEFSDEQVLDAIKAPVETWNETPPPIEVYTTRNFPYRRQWKEGIIARLLMTAAHNYRRNRLSHQAGGVTVDDKNKEREYLADGSRLWGEYKDWLLAKKVSENARNFAGGFGSSYGELGLY